MPTQLETIVSNVDGFVNDMRAEAETQIGNLVSFANSYQAVVVGTAGAASLGGYNTTDIENLAAYVPATLTGFDPPDLSAIVAPPLNGYNTPAWSEQAWSDIKIAVSSIINNVTDQDDVDTLITKLTSGTTQMQVAIYAADAERKQQTLSDAYAAANDDTGALGFSMPTSHTNILKLAAQHDYLMGKKQTERDIVKLVFEWAKEQMQFAVQQGISAHNSDVDYNVRYMSALLQSYATELNGALEKFRATVQALIAKAEIPIKEYNLLIEKAKAKATVLSEADRAQLQAAQISINESLDAARIEATAAAQFLSSKITAQAAATSAVANLAASASQNVVGLVTAAA